MRELVGVDGAKTAVPNEPPIDRKKFDPAVAAPTSAGFTAFWTAVTRICMTSPMPTPRINM